MPDGIKVVLPQNDASILCDARQIEVAIQNLITNSIQATENNGTITVGITEKEGFVDIHIADTGPGIPDEVLPKVFEPLFTTKQTGTGLGLASVKRIIEQHNGTITVSNGPTTFTIRLLKSFGVTE
jgi:signal transduction histidine kinase